MRKLEDGNLFFAVFAASSSGIDNLLYSWEKAAVDMFTDSERIVLFMDREW